jgi:hypothetical protein
MKTDQHLDPLLRSLDAAAQSPLPNAGRAEADLTRILSSPPASTGSSSSSGVSYCPTRPKVKRLRRAVSLGGLAAAVTAGLLIVPAISGGDPAFATWTAAPGTLIGLERDNAVSDCRGSTQRVGDGMYRTDLAAAEVAIAERRGAWVTVILTGGDGFEASCTTDATASWFNKGSFGTVGKPTNATTLPARGIAVTQLGTGTNADNHISMAAGRVGTDVAAMSYTSADGTKVLATVAKGHFAFWLPGNELQDASDHGVPVEVTYSDGLTEKRKINF